MATKEELTNEAKELGLEVKSSATKAEIEAAIADSKSEDKTTQPEVDDDGYARTSGKSYGVAE